MRLLVSGRGSAAQYKEVRGPTGERYAKWKRERSERLQARFAVGFVDNHDGSARESRRLMRNARKRERQQAKRRTLEGEYRRALREVRR